MLVPGDYFVRSLKEYDQTVYVAKVASGFDVAVFAHFRRGEALFQGKETWSFLNQF